MKKTLLALVLLLAASVSQAAGIQMLKSTAPETPTVACGASSTNAEFTAGLVSKAYPIDTAWHIKIHVFAKDAGGTTSTTLIQTAPTKTGPWFTVATITDASATGEDWYIEKDDFVRISTPAVAVGTVKACISAWTESSRIY